MDAEYTTITAIDAELANPTQTGFAWHPGYECAIIIVNEGEETNARA